MSLNFITENDIEKKLDDKARASSLRKTKRNGTSINLRSIVYDCCRASVFQLMDSPTNIPANASFPKGFALMGPVGDAIHNSIQDLLGLKAFKYTEKYMSFNTFAPIAIKTKCDGFDTDNNIFYEIKTKDKMPEKPYEEELHQNIMGAWLFAHELKIPVFGSTMIYINRNLAEYKVFNYNLIDTSAENYLNTDSIIIEMIEKMKLYNDCVKNKVLPPMDHKYIKLTAFGKSNCDNCVYKEVCDRERGSSTSEETNIN